MFNFDIFLNPMVSYRVQVKNMQELRSELMNLRRSGYFPLKFVRVPLTPSKTILEDLLHHQPPIQDGVRLARISGHSNSYQVKKEQKKGYDRLRERPTPPMSFPVPVILQEVPYACFDCYGLSVSDCDCYERLRK